MPRICSGQGTADIVRSRLVKLLFDANLAARLAERLAASFPGSRHVNRISALGASDAGIWQYARDNGFAIVSKDSDFYHMSMLRGAAPKIIWLRVGNSSTQTIAELLGANRDNIDTFAGDADAAFLILG